MQVILLVLNWLVTAMWPTLLTQLPSHAIVAFHGQGPRGTGKTIAIVGLVQLLARSPPFSLYCLTDALPHTF